jgi:potassium efflux system protein
VAALPARRAEREAAISAASTAESRELEREKLVNFEWETRVEEARLHARETQIRLETKLASLSGMRLELLDARKDVIKKTLEAMQAKYGVLVERQQRDLQRLAEHEEVRAQNTIDPLMKYRAKRNAEMLVLKALALQDEHALSVAPPLSLEVQRELADRAERDFAGLKQLVEEGRATAIVALRLKNDYRRLSFERAAVGRTELARAIDEMTRTENLLTAVELDLVNESHDQRYYLDELLEVLPPARRAEARAAAADVEDQHRKLLIRRREALEKLADRAQEIHKQVVRRLTILDDQYAYVRTHIFWMRDAEPIGLATLAPVPTDCRKLARSLLNIAGEVCDRSAWGRVSPIFILALLMTAALPWPLHRARMALGDRVETSRRPPPANPATTPPDATRVA